MRTPKASQGTTPRSIEGILTVLRVDYSRVLKEDILHGIISPTADRADRKPMAPDAYAVSKNNVLDTVRILPCCDKHGAFTFPELIATQSS